MAGASPMNLLEVWRWVDGGSWGTPSPGTQVRKRPTMVSDVVFGLLGLLLYVSLWSGPLAPRAALAQELLQNGGFEDGDAPWAGCGGVSRVDLQDGGTTAAMVRTGRVAARSGRMSVVSRCPAAPRPPQ